MQKREQIGRQKIAKVAARVNSRDGGYLVHIDRFLPLPCARPPESSKMGILRIKAWSFHVGGFHKHTIELNDAVLCSSCRGFLILWKPQGSIQHPLLNARQLLGIIPQLQGLRPPHYTATRHLLNIWRSEAIHPQDSRHLSLNKSPLPRCPSKSCPSTSMS
jgi:hypothetical protein